MGQGNSHWEWQELLSLCGMGCCKMKSEGGWFACLSVCSSGSVYVYYGDEMNEG